ncbi:plasma kallikrein [Drosophila eugracilis]|uniref:plasma kallikrein n=1 Tax=Drosophila eugracilis TaxID=29029 RepID=UPI0007E6F219|nr:plasma kallikrein [Drosophila eugracilis]
MWIFVLFITLLKVFCVKGIFEQCNHQVKLQSGQKLLINSPYYPALYPVGTSCRYSVEAPKDHVLQFKCDLQLQTLSTDLKCRTEVFHFNSEGNEVLTSSEYFCGSGKFERKSFLNRAVISYISNGHSETPSAVKLKDKLSAGTAATSSTTESPQVASIEEQDDEEEEEEEEESENSEEPEENLSDEVLHVLQDVGVSDALAYVASLLYNDDESRKSSTAIYLDKLPTRSSSKTSVKRARIVSSYPPSPGQSGGGGGGRFTCLVEAFQPTCSCGWSRFSRIASPNNEEAILHEFPPMAGVLTKKHGKIFCGAAIIHHHYLLSAAHCFLGPETNSAAKLRVVVGEHDLASSYETFATRRYDLDTLILHEDFSQANGQPRNDIALLRTRTAIIWSRHVGPACLPLQPTEDGRKLPLAGDQVVAAGWGTTSYGGPQTHRLLKATLDVIDTQRCRQTLISTGGVPAHTFCTYTPGRDTCQYDSGGALYERINGRLVAVGIVSFGQGCATQQPSVNTRVASFIKWIRTKSPEVAYCPGRI